MPVGLPSHKRTKNSRPASSTVLAHRLFIVDRCSCDIILEKSPAGSYVEIVLFCMFAMCDSEVGCWLWIRNADGWEGCRRLEKLEKSLPGSSFRLRCGQSCDVRSISNIGSGGNFSKST